MSRSHGWLLPGPPRYVYAHLLIALIPEHRNDSTHVRFAKDPTCELELGVNLHSPARLLVNADMSKTASHHRKGCLHTPDKEQERQMGSCRPLLGDGSMPLGTWY
jgi:hypothetical protein